MDIDNSKKKYLDFAEALRKEISNLSEQKGISEKMYDVADAISDTIRENNVGGEIGRDIADALDKATDRAEREDRVND